MSWFILLEKYGYISENVMLKNSKCVINICCYAPRRQYNAQHAPMFWMVHSKQVADFTGTFKCGKWQYKRWFFEYFWKIKGMNLQNNGVQRMVHHKLMYELGSWMGLSAWTFFMPSIVHALNPIHEPLIQACTLKNVTGYSKRAGDHPGTVDQCSL